MSKFFKDVGNVISYPVKAVYNLATGNPKGNSIGDIFNNTVGPGNPYQRLISDNPVVGGIKKLTGGDLAAPFQTPTWQDLGRPGQAFAQNIDQTNKAFPSFFQPYAEPAEALALSVFNPFAGAALQTAYQGGKEQEQQKGFDWGELGKNAAINFGTAEVGNLAKGALAGATKANALKAFQAGPNSLEAGFNAGNTLDSLTSVGANFAPNATSSALAAGSANALGSIGAIPATVNAVDSFNPNLIGSSHSIAPSAQTLQSSGQGILDSAYKTAVSSATPLANNALTATLAPAGTQPISGALDSFSPVNAGASHQSQYGDILNAFGGGEVNTANPNGPRIDTTAFNNSVNRLAANDYLQQGQTRDVALPAGQYQPQQNTPYANRLADISKSTTQAYTDLLNQTNNANAYYGIIDSNPGLTSDQLNAYLKDPSQGVLGNFAVTPDAAKYLQSVQPLGPNNTSLTALGKFNVTPLPGTKSPSVEPILL